MLLPDIRAWQLNYGPCQRYFEREAEGSLTKSIRRSVLGSTPIVVPPLEKQRNIVHFTHALYKEQQIVRDLLRSGERLMTGMANELHAEDPHWQQEVVTTGNSSS